MYRSNGSTRPEHRQEDTLLSMHEVQQALGHRSLNTTCVYLEQIAVEPDRYSSHIAKRLGLTPASRPPSAGGPPEEKP